MTAKCAPVPHPTTSFWNAEGLPFEHLCSTTDLPTACDIVIIGAGFAGVVRSLYLLMLSHAYFSCRPQHIIFFALQARSSHQ